MTVYPQPCSFPWSAELPEIINLANTLLDGYFFQGPIQSNLIPLTAPHIYKAFALYLMSGQSLSPLKGNRKIL